MRRACVSALAWLLATVSLAAPPGLPKTKDWIEVRTRHFTVYSHVSARQTRKIAADLERFRQVLGLITKGFEFDAPVPTSIYVFRNDVDLTPYKMAADGTPRNVAGYFMTRPFRSYFAIDASAGATPRRILYHEYLHLLLHATFESLPLWLDEGLAEYYSTFRFRDASFTAEIGHPIENHVRFIAGHGLVPLEEHFRTTTRSRSYNEGVRQGQFYAESWLLVHYLAATEDRRKQFGRFLSAVRDGEDAGDALRDSLGMTVPALEAGLRSYLSKGSNFYWIQLGENVPEVPSDTREMTAGEVYYRLGDLLAQSGPWTAEAARVHLDASLEAGGPKTGIYATLGLLAENAKARDEAADWYRKALVTSDPGAEALARYGSFLLSNYLATVTSIDVTSEAPPEVLEARELLRRSVKLEPQNLTALAALGRTFIFEADPEGLAILVQAGELSPFRLDIVRDQARVLANLGRTPEAWALIDTRLRSRADPDELRYVEGWVMNADVRRAWAMSAEGDREGALLELRRLGRRVEDPGLRSELDRTRKRFESPPSNRPVEVADTQFDEINSLIDGFNQAIGLANDGRLTEALDAIEPLLTGCGGREFCAGWERIAGEFRNQAEHNRLVEEFNRAMELVNSGKRKPAIEILSEIEPEVTDEEFHARVLRALKQLGGKPKDR